MWWWFWVFCVTSPHQQQPPTPAMTSTKPKTKPINTSTSDKLTITKNPKPNPPTPALVTHSCHDNHRDHYNNPKLNLASLIQIVTQNSTFFFNDPKFNNPPPRNLQSINVKICMCYNDNVFLDVVVCCKILKSIEVSNVVLILSVLCIW